MELFDLLEVCQTFDAIETTPSRLEKERLLFTLKTDPDTEPIAREMLSIALCWYRHYGMKTLPELSNGQPYDSPDWFFQTIKQIEGGNKIDREYMANVIASYPPTVAKWLKRCLFKDMDMGVSSITANKVFKGCVGTFSVMLADVCENLDSIKYPIIVEPKIDGIRCVAIVRNGKVTFMSRSGKEIFMLDHIGKELLVFGDNVIYDGELYAGSFNETMSAVRRSVNAPSPELLSKVKYHIFDILTIPEFEAMRVERTYMDRQNTMPLFMFSPDESPKTLRHVPASTIYSRDSLEYLTKDHLTQGFEGSIIKKPDGLYQFDRTNDWLKYKPITTGEYKVVSYYEGSGKNKGRLGGLVVELEDGSTNKVGGGFTDIQRDQIWDTPELVLGKHIEVEYKFKTPDGKLREPVFYRLREDKQDGPQV